ncbi:uncharacterized protein LOC124681385 [Lolium rigidum]|uniref:uncharacterized protein LOC124681385 n=1 Tax=Lolium rigidum TaxID=89674 RepID=UPI001F5CF9AF|nr:uncharacterized protein LOC124681385 [Lolium rigidum]
MTVPSASSWLAGRIGVVSGAPRASRGRGRRCGDIGILVRQRDNSVSRVTRVTGKTHAVAGESLKLVVTVAASTIWGSWLARAATSVVLGGLRRDERPRCLREWRVASAAHSWTLRRDDLVCHRCWATWHLVASGGVMVSGGNPGTAAGVTRRGGSTEHLWTPPASST